MQLSDVELRFYDGTVLKLSTTRRAEYLTQVDYLIQRLEKKINEDTSFAVKKFTKTGSLKKGTVLKPREGDGVDADIAVDLGPRVAMEQKVRLNDAV